MITNKYPYTDFHELNLDWILAKIKELSAEWSTTKIAWNNTRQEFDDLKNYVNNYFDNLDIQEEINNKLDEMYEDGSLSEIIKEFFTDEFLKHIVFVEDIGVLPNNIGSVNSANLNTYIEENLDKPITLLFGFNTYNFSEGICIYPNVNMIGNSKGSTLLFDSSTTSDCLYYPDEANNEIYAYGYRRSFFENLTIKSLDNSKSRNCIVFGLKTYEGLVNNPMIRFNNILISGFNTALYIEGYGHTLSDVVLESCNIGFDFVHPEQVTCINCWSNYCNTGLQCNITKTGYYGSVFNFIGGALQRGEIGANIQQFRNINIDTYFELNTHEDIILGDKSNPDYERGVIGANINAHTESSTRETGYYSVNSIRSQNLNINILNATPTAYNVRGDGYSKYINVYDYEMTSINNFEGDCDKRSHLYKNDCPVYGSSFRDIRKFSTNILEKTDYLNSRYALIESLTNGCYSIAGDATSIIDLSIGDSSGLVMADNYLTIKNKTSIKSTDDVTSGQLELVTNNNTTCAIRYNDYLKKIEAYYNGAWHSIATE